MPTVVKNTHKPLTYVMKSLITHGKLNELHEMVLPMWSLECFFRCMLN